jgi:glycosyltransferase involved in cell wall biosynthesis|tara:strand:+ start:5217 stop:6302 length:1086 start_codon:yes stop_codon:yes gene_type:complete
MKNIALVINAFHKNKVEATNLSTLQLAKELNSRGHNAIIVTDHKTNLPEQETIKGVKVYRIKMPFNDKVNKLLFTLTGIRKVEKSENIKFDVIHGFSSSPILATRTILGKPLQKVKRIHTLKSKTKYKKTYLASPILNLLSKVTLGSKSIENIITKHGTPKSKIKYINSHIDLKKFKTKSKNKSKNKKVVLFYGPLADRKGYKYLVDIIPRFKDNTLFIFLCKRSESFKENKKKIDKQLKSQTNYKIILDEKNLIEYLSEAHITVFPYPNLDATESNPLSVIESMAMGVPTITSKLPETQELFRNRKDILFSKPKNSVDLYNKVSELLNNKELQQKLSKNGKSRAKDFDVKLITDKYIELY